MKHQQENNEKNRFYSYHGNYFRLENEFNVL